MGKQEPFELTLSKPIDMGEDEPVKILKFREPVGADLEDMAVPPKMGDFLMFAARLTGQPPALMRRLNGSDALAAIGVASNFFEGGLEIGETSPPS